MALLTDAFWRGWRKGMPLGYGCGAMTVAVWLATQPATEHVIRFFAVTGWLVAGSLALAIAYKTYQKDRDD